MAKEGSRITGVVTSFDNSKGFGFIKSKESTEKLFVHHSSINSDGFRTLNVGSTVEFVVAKGNNGLKAVDVSVLSGAPVRSVNRSTRDGSTSNCYNCKKPGHFSRNCTEPPSSDGGRGGPCFKCGEVGHLARDCDYDDSSNRGCYNCGKLGHMAKDCVSSEVKCYECNRFGHIARDCPNPRNGTGGRDGGGKGDDVECYQCHQFGHFARDCPNPRNGSEGRGSGGGGPCYSCGGFGHLARHCVVGGGGGGGGRRFDGACRTCGGVGHFARDCVSH